MTELIFGDNHLCQHSIVHSVCSYCRIERLEKEMLFESDYLKEIAELRAKVEQLNEVISHHERMHVSDYQIIQDAASQLSRFQGGVEVEGIISADSFGWTTFTFDTKQPKLHGQRVKMLVMKEGV